MIRLLILAIVAAHVGATQYSDIVYMLADPAVQWETGSWEVRDSPVPLKELVEGNFNPNEWIGGAQKVTGNFTYAPAKPVSPDDLPVACLKPDGTAVPWVECDFKPNWVVKEFRRYASVHQYMVLPGTDQGASAVPPPSQNAIQTVLKSARGSMQFTAVQSKVFQQGTPKRHSVDEIISCKYPRSDTPIETPLPLNVSALKEMLVKGPLWLATRYPDCYSKPQAPPVMELSSGVDNNVYDPVPLCRVSFAQSWINGQKRPPAPRWCISADGAKMHVGSKWEDLWARQTTNYVGYSVDLYRGDKAGIYMPFVLNHGLISEALSLCGTNTAGPIGFPGCYSIAAKAAQERGGAHLALLNRILSPALTLATARSPPGLAPADLSSSYCNGTCASNALAGDGSLPRRHVNRSRIELDSCPECPELPPAPATAYEKIGDTGVLLPNLLGEGFAATLSERIPPRYTSDGGPCAPEAKGGDQLWKKEVRLMLMFNDSLTPPYRPLRTTATTLGTVGAGFIGYADELCYKLDFNNRCVYTQPNRETNPTPYYEVTGHTAPFYHQMGFSAKYGSGGSGVYVRCY